MSGKLAGDYDGYTCAYCLQWIPSGTIHYCAGRYALGWSADTGAEKRARDAEKVLAESVKVSDLVALLEQRYEDNEIMHAVCVESLGEVHGDESIEEIRSEIAFYKARMVEDKVLLRLIQRKYGGDCKSEEGE